MQCLERAIATRFADSDGAHGDGKHEDADTARAGRFCSLARFGEKQILEIHLSAFREIRSRLSLLRPHPSGSALRKAEETLLRLARNSTLARTPIDCYLLDDVRSLLTTLKLNSLDCPPAHSLTCGDFKQKSREKVNVRVVAERK